MISYFRRLFTDETAFVGFVRSVLGAVAVLPIEAIPAWARPVALAAALFVRSSTSK